MQLEIITPEGSIFKSSEIEVLTVPGEKGSFQILKGHISIISSLVKGRVKIKTIDQSADMSIFSKNSETNEITLDIISGILENRNNKIVLLAHLS